LTLNSFILSKIIRHINAFAEENVGMVLLLEAVSAVLTFSFWFLKGQVTCILCLCRKQCVQTFNVFDFLKDIVSKVPDLGGSVANGDDHTVKRRCALVNTLVSWN